MKESLIGKTYIASDNSYCVNLSYPERDYRLAGTLKPYQPPREAIIVSEPYPFMINFYRGVPEKARKHIFINVEYQHDIIRVLYFSHNVEANLESRLQKDLERQEELRNFEPL